MCDIRKPEEIIRRNCSQYQLIHNEKIIFCSPCFSSFSICPESVRTKRPDGRWCSYVF